MIDWVCGPLGNILLEADVITGLPIGAAKDRCPGALGLRAWERAAQLSDQIGSNYIEKADCYDDEDINVLLEGEECHFVDSASGLVLPSVGEGWCGGVVDGNEAFGGGNFERVRHLPLVRNAAISPSPPVASSPPGTPRSSGGEWSRENVFSKDEFNGLVDVAASFLVERGYAP